jgi:hypothetical protein
MTDLIKNILKINNSIFNNPQKIFEYLLSIGIK